MSEYAAPLRDMRFVLRELAGLETVSRLPGYGDSSNRPHNGTARIAFAFGGYDATSVGSRAGLLNRGRVKRRRAA